MAHDVVGRSQGYVWDVGTLAWVKEQQAILNAGSVTVSGTVAATQSGSWTLSSKTDLAPSAPTVASVGVSSAQAVAANASRTGLILINTSANTISLAFGANAAVLNSGITLTSKGAFVMDEFCFDQGAINAIASVASSNLAIQEFA